jgi:hypothetical protein
MLFPPVRLRPAKADCAARIVVPRPRANQGASDWRGCTIGVLKSRHERSPAACRQHAVFASSPFLCGRRWRRLAYKGGKGGCRGNSCRTHLVVQRERVRLWRHFAHVHLKNHVDARAIRANKINLSASARFRVCWRYQRKPLGPTRAAE